jgi:hypothetical protein
LNSAGKSSPRASSPYAAQDLGDVDAFQLTALPAPSRGESAADAAQDVCEGQGDVYACQLTALPAPSRGGSATDAAQDGCAGQCDVYASQLTALPAPSLEEWFAHVPNARTFSLNDIMSMDDSQQVVDSDADAHVIFDDVISGNARRLKPCTSNISGVSATSMDDVSDAEVLDAESTRPIADERGAQATNVFGADDLGNVACLEKLGADIKEDARRSFPRAK